MGQVKNASSPKCPQSQGFSTARDNREYEFNLSGGKGNAVWVPLLLSAKCKNKNKQTNKKHHQTAEAGSTTWPCEWPPPASAATHPPQGAGWALQRTSARLLPPSAEGCSPPGPARLGKPQAYHSARYPRLFFNFYF